MLTSHHHKNLKKINNKAAIAAQQTNLKSHSSITLKGEEIVRRIQNYVAQNVAAHSLPFTAGEVALDCVSASLCSVAGGKAISDKAVHLLQSHGMADDAAALHRLKYVSAARNVGGPKCESPEKCASPPRKRQRVQLRRGAIKDRIKVLGGDVMKLKVIFLSKCDFISIIIDEGNSWNKGCPLYVSVLACSPEFEWRIMYIGQV